MMHGRRKATFALAGLLLGLVGRAATGGVLEFTDKDEWFAAVGDVTTITFTEFPEGTLLTDQYEDLGVLFTDGFDLINHGGSFVNDGAGVDGFGDIELAFTTPQAWIAVDYPGSVQFELFTRGKLIYTSSMFSDKGEIGEFAGLLSPELFDAVIISSADGKSFIDDLHFGVPAPGGAVLLCLGALCPRRRRR
jgi:hypothetical protein